MCPSCALQALQNPPLKSAATSFELKPPCRNKLAPDQAGWGTELVQWGTSFTFYSLPPSIQAEEKLLQTKGSVQSPAEFAFLTPSQGGSRAHKCRNGHWVRGLGANSVISTGGSPSDPRWILGSLRAGLLQAGQDGPGCSAGPAQHLGSGVSTHQGRGAAMPDVTAARARSPGFLTF